MLVPTNTHSIVLSSLIGTPYNYWGDDDGDGQGVNGVTATGSLNLSIVDNFNHPVARNEVLTICKAPYKLTLSNGEGTLKTRYGVPNESRFTAGNATYYINPKAAPAICFAKPNLRYGGNGEQVENQSGMFNFAGPANIWNPEKGFLPQSVTPSSYGLNFPTTGAHNLYFDLDISGNNQALSWAPVSHGGITATMTDSRYQSVRVTLTGPVTTPSQWESENPGRIDSLSLPQTFELVGRDSSGNAVVKYGFVLKQWFVNRGDRNQYTYSSTESWCNKIGGYRVPKVKDLTNAFCSSRNVSQGICPDAVGATPSSSNYWYMRYIGAGFSSEWGRMSDYTAANFGRANGDPAYLTSDLSRDRNKRLAVFTDYGRVNDYGHGYGLCVYP